jgi:hypothetical protein
LSISALDLSGGQLRLDSVAPANFYLTAAAIIPIVALVQAVGRRVEVQTRSKREAVFLRRLYTFGRIATMSWVTAEMSLYIWAEFVCLHRLQTGRLWIGGSHLVWVALAYGGVTAALVRVAAYLDVEDARTFVLWVGERYEARARTREQRHEGCSRGNGPTGRG